MDNYIDLKKLNLDELVGVVNLYPWFGGARKQLCERMTGAWGEGQLSDAALYVGSRKMLSGMSKDGWFEGVNGFVFGRPLFYEGSDYMETVTDALSEYGVPLVFDADVGHKAPRMTFINGAESRFDIRDGACHLEYTL